MADDERRAYLSKQDGDYLVAQGWARLDRNSGVYYVDRVRDARGDDECDGSIDCEARTHIEGCYRSRSPQGEDHEAGIEAALKIAHDGPLNACNMGSDMCETRPEVRKLIAAYLSRVSPSRDGTVAVEDVLAVLRRIGEMAGAKANGADARAMGLLARKALAEFSPASTGDRTAARLDPALHAELVPDGTYGGARSTRRGSLER